MNAFFETVDGALRHAIANVIENGEETSPRGKKIYELIGQSISFNMAYPIVTRPSRKIGYRFYAAEALWILSGRNDLEFFRDLDMPFIWEFSDDGFFYNGAYGPRVIDQLTYVCDALIADIETRQAVMEIWRPNPRPSRDIPCTLSYQFIARGGHLHCVQAMRSSDVWLGYPYDAFNAAMLTMYVILLIHQRSSHRLRLGSHTMMIGSQHLYEKEYEAATVFLDDSTTVNYPPFVPHMFGGPQHLLDWLRDRAVSPKGIDPR